MVSKCIVKMVHCEVLTVMCRIIWKDYSKSFSNISSTISRIQRIIVQAYSKEKIMEIPHGDLDNISHPRFVRDE